MAEIFFGITDTGRSRDNNEDTFIAEPVLRSTCIAACVIDGVGGYEGGEVAAALARKSVLDYFSVPSGPYPVMMREAIIAANEKIIAEKQQNGERSGMACVLTLAIIEKGANKFHYAHVGDTRLYLFRDASLVKLTKDHSFVGFLEDSGRLKEAEAMAHPKRNEINKALGFTAKLPDPEEYIEVGESPFLPGDVILLCSDGLSDMINRQQMIDILSSPSPLEQKGAELVNAANEAGGKDNITVVLVQNGNKAAKQRATKPKAPRKKLEVVKKAKPVPPEDNTGIEPPSPSPVRKARPVTIEKKQHTKPGTGKLWIYIILGALVLGGALWAFLANRNEREPVQGTYGQLRNAGEQWLHDTIQAIQANSLHLWPGRFGSTLHLSDTLQLGRDTLILHGSNRMVLSKDSAIQGSGPPMLIMPSAQHIVFDSLTLRDLHIQVDSSRSHVLHLRHVRLQNMVLDAGNPFFIRDTIVSGTLKEIEEKFQTTKR